MSAALLFALLILSIFHVMPLHHTARSTPSPLPARALLLFLPLLHFPDAAPTPALTLLAPCCSPLQSVAKPPPMLRQLLHVLLDSLRQQQLFLRPLRPQQRSLRPLHLRRRRQHRRQRRPLRLLAHTWLHHRTLRLGCGVVRRRHVAAWGAQSSNQCIMVRGLIEQYVVPSCCLEQRVEHFLAMAHHDGSYVGTFEACGVGRPITELSNQRPVDPLASEKEDTFDRSL